MKAMKVLQDNQYRHNDVIKCLKDDKSCMKSGRGEFSGSAESVGSADIAGSAQVSNTIGRVRKSNTKSTLTRSIKTYQTTIKELFKSFMAQMHNNFKEINKSFRNHVAH